jgi:hypothetical protein
MREKRWDAVICDISQGGVCVVLKRRFEKGSALAVELPSSDGQRSNVVFVKVVHVEAHGNGSWRLGCKLVSELSQEELNRLLQSQNHVLASAQTKSTPTSYANVHVELWDRDGDGCRCAIKSLDITKCHPIQPGQQIRLWGQANKVDWSFQVEVDELRKTGAGWRLRGQLVKPHRIGALIGSLAATR